MKHGLFVSRRVAREVGQRLLDAARAAGMDAELIEYDSAALPGAAALGRISCALLSIDLLGRSTKTYLEPQLQTFFDVLRAAPNLQWLQVSSAGMDRPVYGELRERGVRLSSAAGTNARAVVQTAIAGVLALARRLPMWMEAQREHRWLPMRGELAPPPLDGQRAVVVGMGQIGIGIGRVLRALDLNVTGVRRSVAPQPGFDQVVSYDQLNEVLPQTDWLILACPLTELTERLVDATRLALLPPTAHLVNVARGEVVDEPALIKALREGRLAGAYLDVFAEEPLPVSSPLWDMPNVIVSAHSAGNSTGHHRNVVDLFERNLPRFAAGQELINEWKIGTDPDPASSAEKGPPA
ncbi:MAG: D-2-hydroxyacid dehydrogenase [Burkholderiaceae bacterium]